MSKALQNKLPSKSNENHGIISNHFAQQLICFDLLYFSTFGSNAQSFSSLGNPSLQKTENDRTVDDNSGGAIRLTAGCCDPAALRKSENGKLLDKARTVAQ
jgi:hypothetical protein